MSGKHKDIQKVHALLRSEEWHIETVNQRNSMRKDRRYCVHYNHNLKSCKINCICKGAGKCKYYREY